MVSFSFLVYLMKRNRASACFRKMLNHISLQTRLSKHGPRPTLLSTRDCGGVGHFVGCAFGAMRKSKLGRTPHKEAGDVKHHRMPYKLTYGHTAEALAKPKRHCEPRRAEPPQRRSGMLALMEGQAPLYVVGKARYPRSGGCPRHRLGIASASPLLKAILFKRRRRTNEAPRLRLVGVGAHELPPQPIPECGRWAPLREGRRKPLPGAKGAAWLHSIARLLLRHPQS